MLGSAHSARPDSSDCEEDEAVLVSSALVDCLPTNDWSERSLRTAHVLCCLGSFEHRADAEDQGRNRKKTARSQGESGQLQNVSSVNSHTRRLNLRDFD